MISVINTQRGDFQEVTALINHVFGKENSKVKMENIFTDLLCENNMEHMRIVKAEGKPVSVINYILNDVDINGCIMKAANIGAVCTHEDYRHRGYSSLILKDCLKQMRKEGVDFLYVSGEIDLYIKNNIYMTGKMFTFCMDKHYLAMVKELSVDEYEIKECNQTDIHLLQECYDMEAVKFIRDKDRFTDLVGRVPCATVFNHATKVFRIDKNEQLQGYCICAIIPEENNEFKIDVIEYAGKREAVLKGLIKAMAQLNPVSVSGYASWFDTDMLKALEENNVKTESCKYPGTMRIINFTQLMQKLKPLFDQKMKAESLEFYEADGNYIIRSGNMELIIKDEKTLHDLLLGNDMEVLKTQDIIGDPKLLDIIKSVLPIPVPYPYSLNYI